MTWHDRSTWLAAHVRPTSTRHVAHTTLPRVSCHNVRGWLWCEERNWERKSHRIIHPGQSCPSIFFWLGVRGSTEVQRNFMFVFGGRDLVGGTLHSKAKAGWLRNHQPSFQLYKIRKESLLKWFACFSHTNLTTPIGAHPMLDFSNSYYFLLFICEFLNINFFFFLIFTFTVVNLEDELLRSSNVHNFIHTVILSYNQECWSGKLRILERAHNMAVQWAVSFQFY